MPAKNSKYDPDETPILIEQYARDGMTNDEIAAKLGIHRSTLYDWQGKYSDVSDALKNGKEVVDAKVEMALLKRALGYEYEEKKTTIEEYGDKKRKKIEKSTKHMAPDTGAAFIWLKNRKGWRNEPKEAQDDIDSKEYFNALNREAEELWGDD